MATKESIDYVFPDPNVPNGEPDPAIWSRAGTIVPMPVDGVGLGIFDSDNSQSLIYSHATLALGAANPKNTVVFRTAVKIPPVSDGSTAFVGDAIGWRMILDDGLRRAELLLSRDPGTLIRKISLASVPTSPTDFTWDANVEHVFEISRGANGDYTITAIDGGSGAIATKTIPAGALPPSAGTALFGWGFADAGAGAAFWKSAHVEVFSEQVVPPDTSIPEFPTIALPIIGVIGLMFLFQRRNGK